MAKTTLTAGEWTEVATTTVDTLFSSPGGDIKLSTEDPADGGFTDGSYTVKRGNAVVIPAGLTVWGWPQYFPSGVTPFVRSQAHGI